MKNKIQYAQKGWLIGDLDHESHKCRLKMVNFDGKLNGLLHIQSFPMIFH